MARPADQQQHPTLADKIEALPAEKRAEVEDFVDFLAARSSDATLRGGATRLSEQRLAAVWNNDDDAAYDRL